MTKLEKLQIENEELREKVQRLDSALWDACNVLLNTTKMENLQPWEYECAIRCVTGQLMFVSDMVKNDE